MSGNAVTRITTTTIALACLIFSLQAAGAEITEKSISGGEQFTISLQDTPASGYKWMLRSLPVQLMLVSENYRQSDSCGNRQIGCPVERTFTFKGVQKGVGYIHFAYGRPWRNVTEKTASVRVSVRSNAVVR